MVLSEKKLYSVGRRWVYIFTRRKAKKEIPAKLFSCQCGDGTRQRNLEEQETSMDKFDRHLFSDVEFVEYAEQRCLSFSCWTLPIL